MASVEHLFVSDVDPFESPADRHLIESVESELGVTLPEAYIALAGRHNGGLLAKDAHPSPAPTTWAESHVGVNSIAAIGRTAPFSLCGEQGSVFWVQEWGYPDIGVYFADCPSAGHDMLALDYRHGGEPTVAHVDQEVGYRITALAPDFASFLRGLAPQSTFS